MAPSLFLLLSHLIHLEDASPVDDAPLQNVLTISVSSIPLSFEDPCLGLPASHVFSQPLPAIVAKYFLGGFGWLHIYFFPEVGFRVSFFALVVSYLVLEKTHPL